MCRSSAFEAVQLNCCVCACMCVPGSVLGRQAGKERPPARAGWGGWESLLHRTPVRSPYACVTMTTLWPRAISVAATAKMWFSTPPEFGWKKSQTMHTRSRSPGGGGGGGDDVDCCGEG